MYRLAPSEDCSISPASRLSRSTAASRPFYHQLFLDPLLIGLEYPFEMMQPLLAAKILTAGQHACWTEDDRLVHKDGNRHIGHGVIADESKGLMLYLMMMMMMMSLDVHRNQFRLMSTGKNRTATRPRRAL